MRDRHHRIDDLARDRLGEEGRAELANDVLAQELGAVEEYPTARLRSVASGGSNERPQPGASQATTVNSPESASSC